MTSHSTDLVLANLTLTYGNVTETYTTTKAGRLNINFVTNKYRLVQVIAIFEGIRAHLFVKSYF